MDFTTWFQNLQFVPNQEKTTTIIALISSPQPTRGARLISFLAVPVLKNTFFLIPALSKDSLKVHNICLDFSSFSLEGNQVPEVVA